MTQIFTSSGLGLNGSSLTQLGGYGPKGSSSLGQGGVSLSVNVATGNLVIGQQDGFLAGLGLSVDLTSSYNSRGEQGGRWSSSTQTRLIISGTPNQPGSQVLRVDEDGHRSSFHYDAARRLYVAEDGSTSSLSHDNDGWHYRTGSSSKSFDYNAEGQLVAMTDKDNHRLQCRYQDGLLVEIIDSTGKQTVRWRFEQGLLRELSFESDGQRVHHVEYQYDDLNRLTKVSRDQGDGASFWVSYDYVGDSNQIAGIRESDGSSMRFYYDAQGRLERQIDGEGGVTTYSYQSGKTMVTNPLGESWTYFYDEQARLTGIDGPGNWKARYTYEGQHLAGMTQGSQYWSFAYNEFGDCIRIESSNGQVVNRRFDAEHHLLTETHSAIFNGQGFPEKTQTKRFIYDERGHLRFAIAADGVVTEYRYDERGFCTSSRVYLKAHYDLNTLGADDLLTLDEASQWVNQQNVQAVNLIDYLYDWRGQLSQEVHYISVDTAGKGIAYGAMTTRNRYDARGRLVEKSAPVNDGWATTQYVYDDLDRLIRTIDNQGHCTSYEYDDFHQRVLETDARGRQTLRLYDHRGLLLTTQILDASLDYGSVHYEYDKAGRLQVETAVDGQKKYYFYDEQGRVLADVSQQGQVKEYHYDDDGHLVKTITYAKPVDTQNWVNNLPRFENLSLENNPANHVSQNLYNALGQLEWQINAEGAVIGYRYDELGRLLSKTAYATRVNPQADCSHLVSMSTSQDDRSVLYYYDNADRLIAEVNGEGYATEYRYDALGNVLETCRYAEKVSFPLSGDWSLNKPKTSGYKDRHSFHLYNQAGQKIADMDGERYLTTYSYDERGFLIRKQAFYNAVSRQLIINDDTTLDAILPELDSNDHSTSYQYNDLGLLIEERSQNGLVTTYDYDVGGLLLSKRLTDTTTNTQRETCYRYDALGRVTASLDGSGARLLQQAGSDTSSIEQVWRDHSTRFEYDKAGRLLAKTTALNLRSQYVYDEEGQLAFTVNPDGEVIEYRYDSFNQLITTINYSQKLHEPTAHLTFRELEQTCRMMADDRRDEVQHYQYNALGQVVLKQSGSRGEIQSVYNVFGDLIESHERIDAHHEHLSLYSYDKRGLVSNQLEKTDSTSRQHRWEYDAFEQLVKDVDGRGGSTTYAYDHQAKCISITDASNEMKRTSYDAFGRVLDETDMTASIIVKTYSYDDKNNVLILKTLGGVSIKTQFNALGDKLVMTDGNGFETTWRYDENGRVLTVDSPEQHRVSYRYDADGRLVLESVSGSERWSFTYDAQGRVLTKILDPDGLNLTTTYRYDGLGRQLEIIEANGLIKQYTYDNNGNLVQSCIDPDGLNSRTSYDYDDRGLLLRKTLFNPGHANQVVAYEWDEWGRCLATINDPDGLALKITKMYDANDNLISQTDANGHTTYWAYDENNRCRYQVDALGVVTEHRYSINGNEIETIQYANKILALNDYSTLTITDAISANREQDHHQFRMYDSYGRVSLSYDAMGYATSYDYDNNGNVIEVTRYAHPNSLEELEAGHLFPKFSGDDRHQYYAYDGLNRLCYQLDANKTLTRFHHNQAGQLIVKTVYTNAYPFQYDFNKEIIESLVKTDVANDQTTRYSYDNAGRLRIQVSANGVAFRYRYDKAGNRIETINLALLLDAQRLSSERWEEQLIHSSADRASRVVYDAVGREIYRISGEGHVMARQYDAVGNVIAETNYAQALILDVYNEQTVTEALNHQLERHQKQFDYDALGRLSTKTDALKQKTSYRYDGNDNVINKTEANAATWTYSYDAANHLIETLSPAILIKTRRNNQWVEEKRGIVTRNTIDSFGQVIAVVRDATAIAQTRFYTFDKNGHCTQTIYPDVKIDASSYEASFSRMEETKTLVEETRYNAFGEVIATADRAGQWRYMTYNAAGQMIYSIDAEGAVCEFKYDRFGQVIAKTSYSNRLNPNQINDISTDSISAMIVKGTSDRHETYSYNQDNQLIETQRDSIRSYNASTGVYTLCKPTTRYAYNAFGDLVQKSVQRYENVWATTTYYFDRDGLTTAAIDAEGYLTSYSYNGFGEKTAESQYANKVSYWDRDSYTKATCSSKDRVIEFSYDAIGQVIQKTQKNVTWQRLVDKHSYQSVTSDLSIEYSYDALGNLTATKDAMGYTAFWYYDDSGQLIAKVAPPTQQGRALTTYAYDSLGQLVETLRFAQGAGYADATGFTIKARDAQDIITQDIYDENGQLLVQVDGLGHEINYSYNAQGQVARSWRRLTHIDTTSHLIDKRYVYDKNGQLLKTLNNKDNGEWSSQDAVYNAFGEVTAKGVNGVLRIKADYDLLGRLWRSNSEGRYQIYVYDLTDKVTQVVTSTNTFRPNHQRDGIDLSTNWFEMAISFNQDAWRYDLQRQNNVYDALGRLISQTKEVTVNVNDGSTRLDRISQFQTVDRWGNIVAHTNAKGFLTEYDYNAFDQVVKQTLPETLTHDEHMQPQRIKPTQYYAYDALGRLIAMTDANGHTVSKILDAEGHVLQENDAKNGERLRFYDLFGRQTSMQNELNGLTLYSYDAENRLLQVQTTNTHQYYQYDEAGQLLKQYNGCADTQLFRYDSMGNQTISQDARGYLKRSYYDDEGRKIAETNANDTSQFWSYDEAGRLVGRRDIGGRYLTYSYNQNGLLTHETSSTGKNINYLYSGDGLLIESDDLSRLEKVTYSYDVLGQVESKQSSRADANDGWFLENDSYAYDELGRLITIRRRRADDMDSRFPEKEKALLNIDYQYDAVGNIRHSTTVANYTGFNLAVSDDYFTYDENDRMLVNKGVLINGHIQMGIQQGSELTYDDAGNINGASRFKDSIFENFRYFYNGDNQLLYVDKDNVRLQAKVYDDAGRIKEEHLFDKKGNVAQVNHSEYQQGVLKYQMNNAMEYGREVEKSKTVYDYDNVGNLRTLTTRVHAQGRSSGYTLNHSYAYENWDGYQQSTDSASLAIDQCPTTYGLSVRHYDVNGQLQSAEDQSADGSGVSNNTKYWFSAVEGMRARKDRDGQTSYLTVAGKTIGDLRLDANGLQHLNVYGGFMPTGSAQASSSSSLAKAFEYEFISKDTLLKNFLGIGLKMSDFFDQRSAPGNTEPAGVLPDSPQDNFGSYTLQAGDTLESIANQIYGDSSLWYLIADANGISDRSSIAGSSGQLHTGQRLVIPTAARSQHHNSATHHVMDGSILGNTSATTPLPPSPPPPPPGRQHHNLLAKVIRTVVAIVATVVVAAVLASTFGAGGVAAVPSLTGLFATGSTVLGGTAAVGMSASAAMAIGFSAGFIGNMASQGVATMMGIQHGVDLGGALIAGLATAATAGLGRALGQAGALNNIATKLNSYSSTHFSLTTAAQMSALDGINQGFNLALNRQSHFDWARLGISGVTGGLMGSKTGKKLNDAIEKQDPTGGILKREAHALSQGAIQSATTSTTFNATEVLSDNLGDALGSTLTQSLATKAEPTPEKVVEVEEIEEQPNQQESSTTADKKAYQNYRASQLAGGSGYSDFQYLSDDMAAALNLDVNEGEGSFESIIPPLAYKPQEGEASETPMAYKEFGDYKTRGDITNKLTNFITDLSTGADIGKAGYDGIYKAKVAIILDKARLFHGEKIKFVAKAKTLEKAQEIFKSKQSSSYKIIDKQIKSTPYKVIKAVPKLLSGAYIASSVINAYSENKNKDSDTIFIETTSAGAEAVADVVSCGAYSHGIGVIGAAIGTYFGGIGGVVGYGLGYGFGTMTYNYSVLSDIVKNTTASVARPVVKFFVSNPPMQNQTPYYKGPL